MKKLTLVAIFMAFAASLAADELGNTIDFRSATPNAPSSIQALENALTPQNSFQGVPQNSQPTYFAPSYKSTKKGNFDFEFGIGYIMSKFKAEQNWGGSKGSSTATGHGADLFFSGSYYAGESWGVVFGAGAEIINIDWDEPLYNLFCMYACSLDTNSNDLLMNVYLNFGLFKNVWEGDNNGFLRVFGNIGFAVNWLSGGFYERSISCSTYTCSTTLETAKTISIPFTLGLRYMFVENHGLELAGKYDLVDLDYVTKISGASVPNFNTTISRNLSLSVRYIYKF